MGNNQKKVNYLIMVLAAVICVLIGVIGGFMANSRLQNNSQEEVATSATQAETITSVTEASAKTTTEATTETETEAEWKKDAYIAYSNIINEDKDEIVYYYLYDFDKDGIEDMIVSQGTCSADMLCKYYSYKENIGNVYLGSTQDLLFFDDNGKLNGMNGKMGYYEFYEIKFKGGEVTAEMTYEDYTDGDYPYPDGDRLYGFTADDLIPLSNTFLK